MLGAMQARYRYRIYPSPGQQEALARVFGCARVVYNDCLRLREQCHAAGEKISDTQVQRRVITVAKRTPERAWLSEVASVALVQACQDARRAYRNWFDSRSGKRKGRRVGHPKLRCKRGRQSIRLTRNGFALHGDRLYLAKVGAIRVRWSRPLPSVPSSVTVIKDGDGRYYASFVVQRDAAPLPACDREVGIDVGLDRLAIVSAGQVIANPRFLRQRNVAWPRRTGAVPQGQGLGEPGQGPPPGRAVSPGAGDPAGSRTQNGASAGPRQPSGLRRGPGGLRAGPDTPGQVCV